MYRTHTCGELNKKDDKKKVELCGWVHKSRDHGGIIFIDLRDRYGFTQIVFDPNNNKDVHKEAEKLGREDCIQVIGHVRPRPDDMINKKLATGEIEVLIDELNVFSKSDTPPIEVDDRKPAGEDMRMKFRYLDLRRPVMQARLARRHKTMMAAREYFTKNNFLEIQTPMMVKPTPEGARDYVVPSRVNPGKFYSLPQSPQLYKQILMVSGFDRYYQLPICLRDEDLRADRQPEHTQLDLEMSFVRQEDIMGFVEGLFKYVIKEIRGVDIKEKFPIFSYDEAMDKYGIDKPDLRFGLELTNVTDIVKKSDFNVFKQAKCVKCINPEKEFSRKEIDEITDFVMKDGAKGLAWIKITDKGLEGSIVKFLKDSVQKQLLKATKAKKGSILFFIADEEDKVNYVLARLRLELGKMLELIDKNDFKFCWVTDFPLFEWDEENDRWAPCHHIFTSPKQECIKYLEKDPAKVYATLFDVVLNGTELGSGSIRISNPELQKRVMKVIGMAEEEAMKKFGFLIEAYKYGGPPHGGMGLGLDRFVALMCGVVDIREVIAFPKNKDAECLMDGSPSEVTDEQLKELHIKLDVVKKKNEVLEEIKQSLLAEKKEYEIIEHEPVFTSKDAAKARGTDIKQSAKALILKTDKGFIQAIIPGDKEVDLHKLKGIAGVKKIEMASADEVKEVTGCSIGSVPPFGNLFNIDVYVDKDLADQKMVAFNAGSHTTSIKIKAKSWLDVVRPKVESFSK